jgi:hypothetical protein
MTRGVETVLGAIEGWTQPHGQTLPSVGADLRSGPLYRVARYSATQAQELRQVPSAALAAVNRPRVARL